MLRLLRSSSTAYAGSLDFFQSANITQVQDIGRKTTKRKTHGQDIADNGFHLVESLEKGLRCVISATGSDGLY